MRIFKHSPTNDLWANLPLDTLCERCGCQLGAHQAVRLLCPFRWTIEVTLPYHTVADGLDFTDVSPEAALARAFPLAHGIEARIVDAPELSDIREAQGFFGRTG